MIRGETACKIVYLHVSAQDLHYSKPVRKRFSQKKWIKLNVQPLNEALFIILGAQHIGL